jgi:hypothetical protein
MWKSLPVPWSRYDRAWPGPRCILLPRLNLNGLIAALSPKGGGGSGEKVTAVEVVGGAGGASRRRQEPRLGLSGAAAVEELR